MIVFGEMFPSITIEFFDLICQSHTESLTLSFSRSPILLLPRWQPQARSREKDRVKFSGVSAQVMLAKTKPTTQTEKITCHLHLCACSRLAVPAAVINCWRVPSVPACIWPMCE